MWNYTIALTGMCLLSLLLLISLTHGSRSISVAVAFDAVTNYRSDDFESLIIRGLRLPRTFLCVLCGAAFGVSGALIQAATRNPLADTGVLGVNAGAAFFVTVAVGLLDIESIGVYLWFALFGAAAVTFTVYMLARVGRTSPTPVRLVLCGVALSAFLGGTGSAITLADPQAFNSIRSWSIGSVAGREMDIVVTIVPFVTSGLLIALFVSRPLNAMSIGDDLARSLGTNITLVRALTVVAVALLSGAGTAACGPIGFVGLIVPHVVRWMVGPDQRWIIPLTMIYAPVLLLCADIAGRLVLFPSELEVGIVTAFIGAPVLILLARMTKASGL